MATLRRTRNLKLILETGLSSAARTNLERLDTLGASVYVTSGDDIEIRSRESITLRPNSEDIGGSGVGGTVSVGISGESVEEFAVYADTFSVNGEVMPAPSEILTAADLSGYEENLGLPAADGQILRSDTAGNRYWTTLSGVVASQNEAVEWLPAEGTTKVITHGYNAQHVEVKIYEAATGKVIGPEDITYLDTNTIQLDVLEAPANTWYVFLREILT